MKKGQVTHNLVGKRYGKWTVLERGPDMVNKITGRQTAIRYLCECDCGTRRVITYTSLVAKPISLGGTHSGASRGCRECCTRSKEFRLKHNKLHKFWLRNRALMCDTWRNSFAEFVIAAPKEPDTGGTFYLRPINPDAPMGADNVRWVEKFDALNDGRRIGQVNVTINGVTKTLSQWAREERVTVEAIRQRCKKPWYGYKTEKVGA